MVRRENQLLRTAGFDIKYYEYGESRLNLVAERELCVEKAPIVLSGHFDTVPVGSQKWTVNAFSGEVSNGKIWGRGSSDMKGAIAAMISAAKEVFGQASPSGGVRFIFTSDEEPGCLGISDLLKNHSELGNASAIIIGEPTSNLPASGHKGALYLKAKITGRTAHSSMPHLGDNAIYKSARHILQLSKYDFRAEKDPLLGFPTINIGMIRGGKNINSVPDYAEYTVDVRSTPKVDHVEILEGLIKATGGEAEFETLADLAPVCTSETDPFIMLVHDICDSCCHEQKYPVALPYLTEGSVFRKYYRDTPVIILGPGQPEMAHQINEFCYIDKLKESVNIYRDIILKWSKR